ncbi:MAG: 2-isopropylmalate synthase [Thermodesulfobacteriota bacterium]
MDTVRILDTTLRDGDQAAGAALRPQEKKVLARQLERLGVDVIEAGFPAASDAEMMAVQDIARVIKECVVSAFARGARRDIEQAGAAVAKACAPRIEVAVPVSDLHIERQLGKNREQVLEMTRESVRLARKLVGDVQWIGVDSTRADRDYLARHMEAAIAAGASTVSIADTVGFATPAEMDALVRHLLAEVEGMERAVLAVHCHDDLGLATANTLAALLAGAREAQCTVNGLGERAGNAALEELVMAITVRRGVYPFALGVDTRELAATSRMVAEMSGFVVPPNKAVVGSNAFTHGSGMHQDALLKAAETYQIMDPEMVGGGAQRILIGPHSGRRGLRHKLRDLGCGLEGEPLERAFHLVKELAVGRKSLSDDELREVARQCLQNGEIGEGGQP